MKKERLDNNGIAIYVDIWEDNGQAFRFIIPVYNWGNAFDAPDWEDGLYRKWKKENKHPYPYRILEIIKRDPFIVNTKAQIDSLREYLKTLPTEEVDSLRKARVIPYGL